jgi:hypothetical protein
MPGSGQSWDQSQDPRENTVDLPRIDLAGLADYFRGAAPPPRRTVSAQSPQAQSPQAQSPQAQSPAAQSEFSAMSAAAEPTTDDPQAPAVSTAGPATASAADPAEAGAARVSLRAEPAESAQVSRPPAAAPNGRPMAGSLADLRSRLARLPAGHPSSPYEDGGQARPLPTRLRQLELGLPAPGREAGDGGPGRIDVGDSARQASVLAKVAADLDLPPEPEQAEPARELSDADPLPGRDSGKPSGSHDAGEQPAERRRDPQWQDPYAADPDTNGHASLENGSVSAEGPLLGPWPGEGAGLSRPAGNGNHNGNGNGRGEVRPESRRADHGSLEPDRRDYGLQEDHGRQDRHDVRPERELHHPRPDQELHHPRPDQELDRPDRERHHPRQERERHNPRPPRDRSDSHLGSPGPDWLDPRRPEPQQRDTVQRGTPRAHVPDARPDVDGLADLVEQTLARCQAAEGRNTFGTYGSSGLTPAIHRLAAGLPAGGLAPGSEADSLKPADRFAAKLSRLIARNPTRSPADLAETISDAVRYAFAFDAADYTESTWLVHRKLKTQGFELEARRNRWQSPEHKGVFTRWRDPAHGIAFEVQFHTMASWAVAKRTHDAYSRITDPATPPGERAELRARQVAAAASAKPPPGCMEIADFRGEQR